MLNLQQVRNVALICCKGMRKSLDNQQMTDCPTSRKNKTVLIDQENKNTWNKYWKKRYLNTDNLNSVSTNILSVNLVVKTFDF